MNKNSIEQLTELQAELGYVKGEISTVATLGLIGEAGEVLAEVNVSINDGNYTNNILKTIEQAKVCEYMKKRVRDETCKLELMLSPNKQHLFDAELADVFYYINILATNRGLTIFDLAQMSHDKVRAKQTAGGSSEDPKTT